MQALKEHGSTYINLQLPGDRELCYLNRIEIALFLQFYTVHPDVGLEATEKLL